MCGGDAALCQITLTTCCISCTCNIWHYTVSQRKRPTYHLLQSWRTRSDCINFLQKCYWESKKSDDALFSHLACIVLQHYHYHPSSITLGKRKARIESTGALYACNTVQLLQRSQLIFSWTRPPKSPKLKILITRFSESYRSVSMSRESKSLKKSSSDWLNSGNALIQRVKTAMFVFPVLPGNAKA